MEHPKYEEPRICGVPAILLSFVFRLITTVLAFGEQFVFYDCGSFLSGLVQFVSLCATIAGFIAYFAALLKQSEKWMLLVLLAILYGNIQAMMIFVMSLISFTGSDTCISVQVRYWNATCTEPILTCDIFNGHVQAHGGNLDEIIAEYSLMVGIGAAILAICYSASYAVHFSVFKSFRQHRIQAMATRGGTMRAETEKTALNHVVYDLPKYTEAMAVVAPPSYENSEEVLSETVQPPSYQILAPENLIDLIMLSMWAGSQLLVYSTVCWLSFHYIFFEDEYFSDDFDPTVMVARKNILSWYGYCWIMCTCFELGISLERGFSIRNPAKYHKSSTAYLPIVSYAIFSIALSILIAELILCGAQTVEATVGALLSNTLDIIAFSTNFAVLFFAKRKDRTSEKLLNQRYQIREAYSIARAMVPVYFMSYLLKIGIIIINWMYITHTIAWSISEVVYLSFSELSCGLTSCMFLFHHVRLRSKIVRLFNRTSTVIFSLADMKDTDDTTDNYFRMLKDSWERG